MGLDFDQLYPGKFIKAGEFEGKDFNGKISGVKLEELDGIKGKEMKAIVTFENHVKAFVANKTNGTAMREMWGRDTAKWIGKTVTLYPATIIDKKTKKPILAIRVKGSPDLKDPVLEFTEKVGKEQVAFRLVRTGPAPRAAAEPPANPVWDRIVKLWPRHYMKWPEYTKLIADTLGGKTKDTVDENDFALVQNALQGPPPDSAPDAASEVAQ